MTEEKLVERVTALFADSDAAQRKMIRLYAETNDAIEASAIIDSGAEVLHMLQGGLRPEVLVLDSVLSDTTIFPLLRSIRQQQIEYEPHIIVTLMPSAAPQIEKILTLGAEFYRLNHHWWNLPVKSGSYWKMIRRQNEEKSRKESPF